MKSLRTVLASLFGSKSESASPPSTGAESPAEVMRELRLQWLTRRPPTASDDRPTEISAVLMDWPVDAATVTVLVSSGGDASIYTTGTFGVMGGIGHATVRQAAASFIACARRYETVATPTTDVSYPTQPTVRFFFVSIAALRRVDFSAAEVAQSGTPAADLFAHGQAVLTELRRVTQTQQQGH